MDDQTKAQRYLDAVRLHLWRSGGTPGTVEPERIERYRLEGLRVEQASDRERIRSVQVIDGPSGGCAWTQAQA